MYQVLYRAELQLNPLRYGIHKMQVMLMIKCTNEEAEVKKKP